MKEMPPMDDKKDMGKPPARDALSFTFSRRHRET